jgi:hypothetical protein
MPVDSIPRSRQTGVWSLLSIAPDHPTSQGWCMKVRQAYEGRVIEARSSESKDGGWDCEFSIEEHEARGVTETAFYVPGVFPTPEAAIQAAVTAGQQKIDSGFEYKSVVEYRQ